MAGDNVAVGFQRLCEKVKTKQLCGTDLKCLPTMTDVKMMMPRVRRTLNFKCVSRQTNLYSTFYFEANVAAILSGPYMLVPVLNGNTCFVEVCGFGPYLDDLGLAMRSATVKSMLGILRQSETEEIGFRTRPESIPSN